MLYNKFESNFKNLLSNCYDNSIAVAVSGGVDSIALLLLASYFTKKHNMKLVVMTVNHNLRTQSEEEVRYVADLSYHLSHTCVVLNWSDQTTTGNLQSKARSGRYQLLTHACQKLDILTLLTAHHLDDSIENFIIKSNRKSGIIGLSNSHSKINFIENIRLIRPLYNIEKKELIHYLQLNKVSWYEDSSNKDMKYHRNKIRYELNKPDNIEYKEQIKQDIIYNEQYLLSNISNELVRTIAEAVVISKYGYATINCDILLKCDYENQIKILSYALTVISGYEQLPRAKSIEFILQLLNNQSEFIKTLHGCILYCKKYYQNTLIIYREFGKNNIQDIKFKNNNVWDNRFYIKILNNYSYDNMYITRLSVSDYKYLKTERKISFILKNAENICDIIQKQIIFTLPVIKKIEKIIALPHISYYDDISDDFNIVFKPNFISNIIHF